MLFGYAAFKAPASYQRRHNARTTLFDPPMDPVAIVRHYTCRFRRSRPGVTG
jgi:hypothetical protein